MGQLNRKSSPRMARADSRGSGAEGSEREEERELEGSDSKGSEGSELEGFTAAPEDEEAGSGAGATSTTKGRTRARPLRAEEGADGKRRLEPSVRVQACSRLTVRGARGSECAGSAFSSGRRYWRRRETLGSDPHGFHAEPGSFQGVRQRVERRHEKTIGGWIVGRFVGIASLSISGSGEGATTAHARLGRQPLACKFAIAAARAGRFPAVSEPDPPPAEPPAEPDESQAVADSPAAYRYGERDVGDLSAHALRPGEGRITGGIAFILGVGSFLGVMCFHYPEIFTTRELREVYDVPMLRNVLMVSMYVALGTGIFSFIRRRGRGPLGAIGVAFTIGAFLAGGYRVPVGAVHQVGPGIGVDWMVLDLLKSTIIFIFLEKMWPKYPEQPILRPEWQLDLGYFAVNHLLIGVLLIIANGFAPSVFGWATNDDVQRFVSGLWLPAQVLLLVFCADFVQYWVHRAYHEIPWLWGLHAVHHSAEHIDWLAGSRTHVVQTLFDRSLVFVPLYLLGPDREALNIYVVIVAFQAVLIHSNLSWNFGPLRYLMVTPQFHHWHHSKDKPAIDTNYAAHLPVLDMMFRSYHLPDGHWPKHYGTLKRLPRTFFGQLLYPFQRTSKKPAK